MFCLILFEIFGDCRVQNFYTFLGYKFLGEKIHYIRIDKISNLNFKTHFFLQNIQSLCEIPIPHEICLKSAYTSTYDHFGISILT